MSTNPANFDETLRDLGRGAPEALSVHPDYRDLGDYVEESLSPQMTEAVQEHLAYCERCADVVLELMEPSGQPEQIDKRILEPAVTAKKRNLFLLAIAALLAFLAIGSHFWYASGKESPPPSSAAPAVLADVSNVESGHFADALGNSETAIVRGNNSVVLHRGGSPSQWGLQWFGTPTFEHYRLRIVADGQTLWEASARPDPEDSTYFAISLSPDFFAPGAYTIELLGAEDPSGVPLATWALVVQE